MSSYRRLQDVIGPVAAPTGPGFPTTRMRRNRRSDWSRRLTRENTLTAADLIWPVFVREGRGLQQPVEAMPGVFRYSCDRIGDAAAEASELGIPVIAIFPFIEAGLKDAEGSIALQADNLVCRAIRAVRDACPDIGIQCDVALDPFTSHGHDGLVSADGEILNDETVDTLCRQALIQADAGCDVISPSDMMDGRVGAIRRALDNHGHQQVQIMAYSAKYASAFYGPFREAVGSATNLGYAGKSTYQMDPANGDEALREAWLDIAEGADMIMVKPGLPYLDIVRRLRDEFGMPTYAYQVSGEYAMIQAAAGNGWIDGERLHDGKPDRIQARWRGRDPDLFCRRRCTPAQAWLRRCATIRSRTGFNHTCIRPLARTMQPRAILFDLDDTLISPYQRGTVFWRDAICQVWQDWHDAAIPLPPDLPELVDAVQASAKRFWSDPARHKTGRLNIARARFRILDDGLDGDSRFPDTMREAISVLCGDLIHDATRLYPDAVATLEGLRAKGIAMALITNGAAEVQRAKIDRFALSRHFDHVQIEGEAGVGKPEPEAYHRALAALDARPRDTWMIGDNLEWEVAAPQALGIFAIWRDPKGRGVLPAHATVSPDRIVKQLSELLD